MIDLPYGYSEFISKQLYIFCVIDIRTEYDDMLNVVLSFEYCVVVLLGEINFWYLNFTNNINRFIVI